MLQLQQFAQEVNQRFFPTCINPPHATASYFNSFRVGLVIGIRGSLFKIPLQARRKQSIENKPLPVLGRHLAQVFRDPREGLADLGPQLDGALLRRVVAALPIVNVRELPRQQRYHHLGPQRRRRHQAVDRLKLYMSVKKRLV